jgi:hypothetical protein
LHDNNPPEVQTDKAKTKIVECTELGCGQKLVVNVFYAPHRARCSRHRDTQVVVAPEKVRSAEVAVAVGIPTQVMAKLAKPPEPNHSLEELCCPFGHGAMTIRLIHPSMGFITFKCGHCLTAVEIMPGWAALLMNVIPMELRPIVKQFNLEMKERGAKYVESESYARPIWMGAENNSKRKPMPETDDW